jgi:hypothetical protein
LHSLSSCCLYFLYFHLFHNDIDISFFKNKINNFIYLQHNSREERDLRSINAETPSRSNRVSAGATSQVNGTTGSGDEEWRNIHTMLSCISGMVDKTKRAISILQHRGNDQSGSSTSSHHESNMITDIRRQTEEKIAEFRRNAEDAVNQVQF